MKAVVLEVRGEEAALLREDGVIVKIRQKCQVGDTIELKGQVLLWQRKAWRRAMSAAAAAAIILGGGGAYGYHTTFAACSYISLDINPSIEYTLNRKNRVLSVTSENEEAAEIVEKLQEQGVKGNSLSEALQMTEELLKEGEYLTDDSADYILINVVTDTTKRKDALMQEAKETLGQDEEKIHLVMTDSTVSDRKEAKKLGISSGRYKKLVEYEEYQEMDLGEQPDDEILQMFAQGEIRDLVEPWRAGGPGGYGEMTEDGRDGNPPGWENRGNASGSENRENPAGQETFDTPSGPEKLKNLSGSADRENLTGSEIIGKGEDGAQPQAGQSEQKSQLYGQRLEGQPEETGIPGMSGQSGNPGSQEVPAQPGSSGNPGSQDVSGQSGNPGSQEVPAQSNGSGNLGSQDAPGQRGNAGGQEMPGQQGDAGTLGN